MTRLSTVLISGLVMTAAFALAHSTPAFAQGNLIRLACVTAKFDGVDIQVVDAAGIDPETLAWNKVFAEDVHEGDDDLWGLSCKGNWANTGCNLTSPTDESNDWDLYNQENGCRSDDPEFEDGMIMDVTCCKVKTPFDLDTIALDLGTTQLDLETLLFYLDTIPLDELYP